VPPGRLALPDEQQRDDQVQSLHPKHCSHSERSVALERPSPHMDGVHQGILSVPLEAIVWAHALTRRIAERTSAFSRRRRALISAACA
jgi:hypothetical protein